MWIPLKKTFSHPSKLSEFWRHLELCFLVAMVAYCLSCSIVNTLSINSNRVCFTAPSISLVRSLQYLPERVSTETAAQRNSTRKGDPPQHSVSVCAPGNEFLLYLSWSSSPSTLPLVWLKPVSRLLWLFEPCSALGIPSLESFLLFLPWCHALNYFYFSFSFI